MKKLLIKTIAAATLLAALAVVSVAQSNNKRIQFAKGKTSAVETFTLPADDGITYIIGVKKWNLLKYTVTGLYTNRSEAQGLGITLTKLGSENILLETAPGEEGEYQFSDGGGDYVITVMNPGNRKANIKLKVSINAPSQDH